MPAHRRGPAEQAICFGTFHLLPGQRPLLEDGHPVHLGSRALDILVALVERTGHVVEKHELMARVWPDSSVEENNLSSRRRAPAHPGRGSSRPTLRGDTNAQDGRRLSGDVTWRTQ
jgi:hypothetical protein